MEERVWLCEDGIGRGCGLLLPYAAYRWRPNGHRTRALCKACDDKVRREQYRSRRSRPITVSEKRCRQCRQNKPSSAFSIGPGYRDNLSGVCKACDLKRQMEEYARNPEKWQRAQLKTKYGLSMESYRELLDLQGGVCAICQDPSPKRKRLAVDHDHVTGEIRGLVCNGCNLIIGIARENGTRLMRAAAYLENPPARSSL